MLTSPDAYALAHDLMLRVIVSLLITAENCCGQIR